MEQLIPWLIFCIAVSLLCLFKPNAARIFVGVFFIIMAVGVNVVLSIVAPEQFVKLGTDTPLIPFYGWFFQNIVALAPQLIGILAAAGETALGLLILSGGRQAKLGLLGAIIFLIVITPLGIWTLPNPVLAVGLARLLTKEHPRNMLHILRSPRGGTATETTLT
jgi:hypothetical protein